MSGRCLEGVLKNLEGIWRASEVCLDCDWKVSGRCLEGVWKVCGWCFRILVVWGLVEGVWRVPGGCLEGVWSF